MEDFFEKILKPGSSADRDYIRAEVTRLRAHLYTFVRDDDRQREIERLQTDLTYWHLVMSHKGLDFNYGLFEYGLYCLSELKRVLDIQDSVELCALLDLAEEFNCVECGHTIADLPNRDKVSEIIYILDGGANSGFGVYRAFALIGVEPSRQGDEEPKEKTQPRKLPQRLSSAKIKHKLKGAQNLGLLDDDYYWIGGSIALCAFFCACLNASCNIHAKAPKEEGGKPRNEWKLHEGFLFRDGKFKGRKVDLSNNFGTNGKIGRKTLNEGIYRNILDLCGVSLSKIIPLQTKG